MTLGAHGFEFPDVALWTEWSLFIIIIAIIIIIIIVIIVVNNNKNFSREVDHCGKLQGLHARVK